MPQEDVMPLMTRDEIFAEMERMGIARIEVTFSGGGDEGGVDHVFAFDADGIGLPFHFAEQHFTQQWDSKNHKWVVVDPVWESEIHRLTNSLTSPIYERYHTFAGDFQVHGMLIYDLSDRTVSINGEESVMASFEEEL